jgi:hypothetical protein
MELRIDRNDNYAPGDIRANYFLMAGDDCIGGIDTHSGTGLVATIHIPSMVDEDGDEEDNDNWNDCTIVCQRTYESETDLEAVKTDLLRYAEMAIASGGIVPRTRQQLDEMLYQAMSKAWR